MTAARDALRSFLRVWVVGTLMLWLPGLFGWINDVTAWARAQGATPFPDAHGLAYLFVAAITSAFVAAGSGVLRYVENLSGTTLLPRPAGPAPVGRHRADEAGAVDTRTIAVIALVLAVIVVLVLLT